MSIFTKIKEALLGNWLKSAFSKDNLKQPSTWQGLIRLGMAAGLFTLSQEAQDALITLVIQLIATGEMAKGVIDAVRNENKKLPWQDK